MQGKNQLNALMPEIPFLKELPIDPSEKKFTCKFKQGIDTSCRTEQSPDTSNAGLYRAGIQRRWDGCMEPLRIPSRCDRFLYRLPSNKILTVLYYKVLNLLADSDHNAIWSVVDITDGQGEVFPAWGDKYPNWKLEQFHLLPDPRARFASAGNQDRPSMPPDDPASMAMAPNPQKPGKRTAPLILTLF